MKKDVVVTLADDKFVDQAKQLFSTIYHNAGWKGEYLLLAYNMSKVNQQWFKGKGIHVLECHKIRTDNVGKYNCPPIRLLKFNIFDYRIRQWDRVIFLDADIIVRASLDELIKKKGFWACSEGLTLEKLYTRKPSKVYNDLKEHYNLSKPAFNSGVMKFDTHIVKKKTKHDIINIFERYHTIQKFADQPALNLYFLHQVNYLPIAYNTLVSNMIHHLNIKPENIDAIVLHFIINKPWQKRSYFYKEWNENLRRAEDINVKESTTAARTWSLKEIQKHTQYIEKRKKIYYYLYISQNIKWLIHRALGIAGSTIRKISPSIYRLLGGEKK